MGSVWMLVCLRLSFTGPASSVQIVPLNHFTLLVGDECSRPGDRRWGTNGGRRRLIDMAEKAYGLLVDTDTFRQWV